MMRSKGIWWILLVLSLLGVIGRSITGQVAYARLAYVCFLLFFVSLIWSALSLRGVQLHRDARLTRASVGEVFEEHFEISVNSWPGCAWVEVVNQSSLPMASGSRLLTRIGSRKKRFYSSRTLLIRRGAYLLGPTLLASGDPFGIFPTKKIVLSDESLIVLPMTVNIPTFPPPPGLLPGGKAIRQKTMDVTPHAAGIREYVPGDPMKRIHWASTARRGRFMVKEFEQDPQSDIWIFLDAHRDRHYFVETPEIGQVEKEGFLLKRPKISLPCDSFEYSISAAASLARFFISEKRSVGLICASSHLTIMSAERGERQIGKLMETLAFLQPDGKMPLLGLVNMQAKLLPVGSGVILITSAVSEDILTAVEDLTRRNLVPVVILLMAETFGGPRNKSDSLLRGILGLNIPVCPVQYGDDLGNKLSLPAVYFQHHNISKSYFSTRYWG